MARQRRNGVGAGDGTATQKRSGLGDLFALLEKVKDPSEILPNRNNINLNSTSIRFAPLCLYLAHPLYPPYGTLIVYLVSKLSCTSRVCSGMYSKRATLVTFNSLRSLLKLCDTRSRFCVESIKPLSFARNLSTATERSDFYNANYVNGDDFNQVIGFNEVVSDGSGTLKKHQSEVYGQSGLESVSGKLQQSSNGYGMLQGGLDSMNGLSQQRSSGFYGGQYGMSQQNSRGHYAGSTGIFQGGFDSMSGQSQQSSSGFYGGQYEISEQNSGGYYAGNTGFNQQSVHNARAYQQNESEVNYFNARNYWQNQNDSQNRGMVASQITNDLKQNEKLVEVADIKKLDEFCKEGKVKEAVKHLGLLEQQHVPVDFSRYVMLKKACFENKSLQEVKFVSEYFIKSTTNPLGLLDGFCKEGKLKEAVELLELLELQHFPVDLPRYVMLMEACGENKALEEAKYVHEHLMRSIPNLEVKTNNKILEMYSKCGAMNDAFVVFDQMPKRNLTSWEIMITWLVNNGFGEASIELFTEFKRCGLKPDGQMFIKVFSVCGIIGDIVEGMLHFESMSKDYRISPSMEHYVSVVAMLGSAGCLDEALEFIEQMPIEPGIEIWETLMNFCRIHGHKVLGDRCAELVELLDPLRLDDQSRAGLISIKASDLEGEKKKLSNRNPLDVRSTVFEYRAAETLSPLMYVFGSGRNGIAQNHSAHGI
ncbi:unnamed protein product [Fraxinus pennsylvanica]|uniref:Pentatricopeptide repeat-containing protein n=1 Tax=Fraxinus pennsylvanica TaxID=56036 RepID=A0AAD1YU79_9LAMI|nr:unnamed protein product [Fraxinus pennsylvanica]